MKKIDMLKEITEGFNTIQLLDRKVLRLASKECIPSDEYWQRNQRYFNELGNDYIIDMRDINRSAKWIKERYTRIMPIINEHRTWLSEQVEMYC